MSTKTPTKKRVTVRRHTVPRVTKTINFIQAEHDRFEKHREKLGMYQHDYITHLMDKTHGKGK